MLFAILLRLKHDCLIRLSARYLEVVADDSCAWLELFELRQKFFQLLGKQVHRDYTKPELGFGTARWPFFGSTA